MPDESTWESRVFAKPNEAEAEFKSNSAIGWILFNRGTQTIRDYLRSGRIIFCGVRKLLGKHSAGYRMLSEGPKMYNSLRQQRHYTAKITAFWRQLVSRTFKKIELISRFNAFVKLTKAVTFLFGICEILSLMTNWRSASASPDCIIWRELCVRQLMCDILAPTSWP